jgi:dihydroorotase-like cyclic amidohydrolase
MIPDAIQTFEAHSAIDFGLIVGITMEEHLSTLSIPADQYGISAFKFYLGYRGHESRFGGDFEFSDERLVEVFEQVRALQSAPLLCIHCENAEISRYFRRRTDEEVESPLRYWNRIAPLTSEIDASIRVSALAWQTGVRTAVLHVSNGTTAGLLAQVPWRQHSSVIVETCPHYLAIDDDDPSGMRAIVRPPIRDSAERNRLWDELRAGHIDTIGSDNAANDLHEKSSADIRTVKLGFGEIGLSLPVLLEEGYHRRGIPLQRLVALTSANVARAHGLYPGKGVIQVGSDADFVGVDLDAERRLDPATIVGLKGVDDGSVYGGRTLRGRPVFTVRSGKVVVRDGKVVGDPSRGRYLGHREVH